MDENIAQEEEPINIEYLNNAVNAFYNPETSEEERNEIHSFLNDVFQRKDLFLFIKDIILSDSSARTKFLSMSAFKNYINSSWELVPPEARQDIRQFLWNLLFIEKADVSFELKTKMVESIISISKYEYPQFWPDFVKDLISVSEQSIEDVLNCFDIFSQEISDFADNSLTSARAAEMLNAFTEQLQDVIDLIQKSFSSNNENIVKEGLKTFSSLVKWIDPQFFFQSDLLNQLCASFLEEKQLAPLVITILGRIVSLSYIPEDYFGNLGPIFSTIIAKLQALYTEDEENFFTDKTIVSLLAVTLTSFLSQYSEAIEIADYYEPIVLLHQWLIHLTGQVDADELEAQENNSSNYIDPLIRYWRELAQRVCSDLNPHSVVRELYDQFLPSIRRVLVLRIPSPYEFRDVVEEDGFRAHRIIFKTKLGDLFYTAKDALEQLAKLDIADTINAIKESLQAVQENGFGNLDLIKSTCWSFGAIVNVLSEQSNKTFVHQFLDYFISLFGEADNMGLEEDFLLESRRVVGMASCFIATQSYKFLRRDDELFSNIINWMLSLLSYPDDEIKAVSIQCLQLLCSTNKDQMTSKQKNVEENQSDMSLLEQILLNFQTYYSSLSESSLLSLFTLTAFLIKNFSNEEIKQKMFAITSNFLNTPLHEILPLDPKVDQEGMHSLTLLVQCNTALAISLGNYYVNFFLSNFDLLNEAFTTLTGIIIQNSTESGTDVSIIRSARAASDAIIMLFDRTLYHCNITFNSHDEIIHERLFPICMKTILPSFVNTPPIAKSPKVLKLFGTLAMKCRNAFCENFQEILENIYHPVLQMIKDDFVSYENIRLDFYGFISSLIINCIEAIISLPSEEIGTFIEAIQWGMRHTQSDVSEKSHSDLIEFINSIKNKLRNNQEELTQFTNTYAVPLLMFAFEIMTDTAHKFAFQSQVSLIKTILTLPAVGDLGGPIFEGLSEMFPDQGSENIEQLLMKLMESINESGQEFSNILKDFLISVKHLLPQDPDLKLKDEARQRTQDFFKQIEEAKLAPLEGLPDML